MAEREREKAGEREGERDRARESVQHLDAGLAAFRD